MFQTQPVEDESFGKPDLGPLAVNLDDQWNPTFRLGMTPEMWRSFGLACLIAAPFGVAAVLVAVFG